MLVAQCIWLLVGGLAAVVLGRAVISFDLVPFALQTQVAAIVFVLAAALVVGPKIIREDRREVAFQLSAAAVVMAALASSFDVRQPGLALMYSGIFVGAASEELVFRLWLPRAMASRDTVAMRQRWLALVVPAACFALSHLLVQHRFSPERTGRLLLLLFVAAILYAAVVQLAGVGLAAVIHAILNSVALEIGAKADRPEMPALVLLLSAAAVLALGHGWLSDRLAGRKSLFVSYGVGAAVLLAAALAAATGNLARAPMVTALAAGWTLAAMLVRTKTIGNQKSIAPGSSINSFTRTRNNTAC